MKIAMLTTTGERCGIAAYTRALIEGLKTLPDVEIDVVSIQEGAQPVEHYREQAERLNAPDVDVVHIQHEYSFWGGILPPPKWELDRSHPLLTGLSKTVYLFSLLAREQYSPFWQIRYLIKKPVVLTAHTTTPLGEMLILSRPRPLPQRIAIRFIEKKYKESVEIAPFVAAMTIVHTAAARNELIARGAQAQYVKIVPTGVPQPLVAPTGGQAFRERFALQGRRLVTLFGYISRNKGYELAFEILPALPRDVTLVIAGGIRTPDMESYLADLKAMVLRAGLQDRVVFTGVLPDVEVSEAMAASEMVLVPHTQATGSYSVMIPLTHGKPTVASDLDCFREISLRLDCLELFHAADVNDFREKTLRVLNDDQRRDKLAVNAVKYATRFSWPRVAAMTHKVYQEAIDVYGRGHHPRQVRIDGGQDESENAA